MPSINLFYEKLQYSLVCYQTAFGRKFSGIIKLLLSLRCFYHRATTLNKAIY